MTTPQWGPVACRSPACATVTKKTETLVICPTTHPCYLNSFNHTLPYNIFHSLPLLTQWLLYDAHCKRHWIGLRSVLAQPSLTSVTFQTPSRCCKSPFDSAHTPESGHNGVGSSKLARWDKLQQRFSFVLSMLLVHSCVFPFQGRSPTRVLPLATKVLLSWYSDKQIRICVLHKRPPAPAHLQCSHAREAGASPSRAHRRRSGKSKPPCPYPLLRPCHPTLVQQRHQSSH